MAKDIKGSNAIGGAVKRIENYPSNHLSDEDCRLNEVNTNWDGQWYNWDDLGSDDPTPGGWGDISD